ncbi:GNAT family N-acetyltransferase [Clostridium algidicarnis]|uniref:GNAT family N-acetyltransferase n=1 Tax=Clostridium algidicarnis TaxID=37659 RepID=UPI001C0BE4D7|nr:GNAT family N-acetyltransferase [Clostridium algidicarnis]MBU3197111.1 GNAT family N-acetyltransferase [Clostridium algidicarnis]MBU3228542.1 GNAT family N-acetyltransferase [Clostridium algidicarnis]MBU3251981.1 GNAT family N-acetyltransferase [Clostridium algidicarnis]
MNEAIRLEVALENDARQIRDMMISVERDEADRWYYNGERPFIPGYNSINMQKYHMWDKRYYKIMYNEILAGVLLLSYTGREHARVDRFYVDPTFQNKGVGSKVITLMEEMYPMVRIWTLDTIQKSSRNHKFYEKNGYRKIGEDEEERYYKKVVDYQMNNLNEAYSNKDFGNESFHQCNMQKVDFYDVNMKSSRFTNISLEKVIYQNVNISNARLTNTNMSGSVFGDSNMNKTEICHVSLADAYIHDTNLGFQGEKVPLTMERCELTNSTIVDSNLENLSICNCNIEGMKIDGILISDLINIYKSTLKANDDNM